VTALGEPAARLFFADVDSRGEDVRRAVHGVALGELASRVARLAWVGGLGLAASDALWLAGWLRDVVKRPEGQDLIACAGCGSTAIRVAPLGGGAPEPVAACDRCGRGVTS